MGAEFQFVHASDLRLGEPLRGITEPSAQLRKFLQDAPYRATERIIDATLDNNCEFLLLTGNVMDLSCFSPRGVTFLQKQFQRLDKAKIPVFWVAGEMETGGRWPTTMELPSNVTMHLSTDIRTHAITKNGQTLCSLLTRGYSHLCHPADFRNPGVAEYCVAAVYGQFPSDDLFDRPIDYWALGGTVNLDVATRVTKIALSPGAAQARSFEGTGHHGATFVAIDEARNAHLEQLDCAGVRYYREVLPTNEGNTERLKDILGARALEIATECKDAWGVVEWVFVPDGENSWLKLSRQELTSLTKWMQKEFGQSDPGVWTESISFDVPMTQVPSEVLDEDSIRGDFLRALEEISRDEQRVIDLRRYLPTRHTGLVDSFEKVLLDLDREPAIARARCVGLELLSGSN